MKILKQMSIILGISLISEVIVRLLPFAFPSSVMAIVIVAGLLLSNVMKESHIRETGDFLLANMALVFVPVSVGMIEDIGVLKGKVTGFLIVVCISLVITFLGSYGSVRLVQICMEKYNRKGGTNHE